MPDSQIVVQRAAKDFRKWDLVLELLRAAFAYQECRINPPSSVNLLDAKSLAEKSSQEHLFLATSASELAGCVFARDRPPLLHVSKLAVWPQMQGRGIGRRLMSAIEDFARESGRTVLELETRIELTENHRTFEALGYRKVAEHAHDGFDRPTYIRMQRVLGATPTV
jgi:ribosomal protein S18 acetylase RimI-like enzyme